MDRIVFLGYVVSAKGIEIIVMKPNPKIDPVKRPGPGFYGSTHTNTEYLIIYEPSLQIKQNSTPAHVMSLPLLLSMLSFTCKL